ncbi:MAG: phosphopantothenoylcysteine decarboxylase [Planctomycetota bacterium]
MPDTTTTDRPLHPLAQDPIRLLLAAGGTREPIDPVRYLGNRSSGRMGAAIADAAHAAGWRVSLLLGTNELDRLPEGPRIMRFESTAQLQELLRDQAPACDILVMAAAVADYRPAQPASEKLRRVEGRPLTLELTPTPDLLAEQSARARHDQMTVGFALEPEADLLRSGRDKLSRKRADLIIANPIETLDADGVRAVLIDATGERPVGTMPKARFAELLVAELAERLETKRTTPTDAPQNH